MVEPEHRWWYCTECFAINDGLEQARCWNCDHYERKRKHFPWCQMGTKQCDVCGKRFVTWTLPPGTTLTIPDVQGFCPFYFDHYGKDAYTEPILPTYYVLDANGYRYDEDKDKLIKTRLKL